MARCAHSHGAPTEAADTVVELLQRGELGRARSLGEHPSEASPDSPPQDQPRAGLCDATNRPAWPLVPHSPVAPSKPGLGRGEPGGKPSPLYPLLPDSTGHLSPCSTQPVCHQVRRGPAAGTGRDFSRAAVGSGVEPGPAREEERAPGPLALQSWRKYVGRRVSLGEPQHLLSCGLGKAPRLPRLGFPGSKMGSLGSVPHGAAGGVWSSSVGGPGTSLRVRAQDARNGASTSVVRPRHGWALGLSSGRRPLLAPSTMPSTRGPQQPPLHLPCRDQGEKATGVGHPSPPMSISFENAEPQLPPPRPRPESHAGLRGIQASVSPRLCWSLQPCSTPALGLRSPEPRAPSRCSLVCKIL